MAVGLVMEVEVCSKLSSEVREQENKVWWSNQTVTGKVRAHTRKREEARYAR